MSRNEKSMCEGWGEKGKERRGGGDLQKMGRGLSERVPGGASEGDTQREGRARGAPGEDGYVGIPATVSGTGWTLTNIKGGCKPANSETQRRTFSKIGKGLYEALG